ncbi:MAG: 30S ribosomal protein S12 methylthiotransferase RimO [Spirochaetota bacterium]|nr:MAG: 30S ribosomal protein S12 methylthiotransferase RimO [Spirochaetota bacterium]
MQKKSIFLESLGCSRNAVDSETILSILESRGHDIVHRPEDADILIINTCAFIDDAKEETIDTILEMAEFKKKGSRLIVAGCFSQIYYKELLSTIPEVDAVTGIGDLTLIIDAVENSSIRDYPESRIIGKEYREYLPKKKIVTQTGFAYIKIAEGCSKQCSFCLIPKIKGPMRSRVPQNIVSEARLLDAIGVKEVVLTSQDTLFYGQDLGMKRGLVTLVKMLQDKTDIAHIRLLYLAPSKELLECLELFGEARVVPYFDIPIQHVSKEILKSMKRIGDYSYYKNIIDIIRERFPDAVLRTTLIVGYPGETEDEFEELKRFVKEARFNHLGVFKYSPQRETEAYKLKGRVRQAIAEKREGELLEIQREISRHHLEDEIGKQFWVLVEERVKHEPLYLGRSYHFAPEVDGTFVIRSEREIEPGTEVIAEVIRADDYDLHGVAD